MMWFKDRKLQKQYEKYGVTNSFKIDGHSFRIFSDAALIPVLRNEAYRGALRDYQNGVEAFDLNKYAGYIIAANDAGKKSDVGFFAHNLRNYTALTHNEDLLLSVANSIILLNDESVTTPEQKNNELKLKICQESSEVKAFFLTIALKWVGISPDSQTVSEVMDYLTRPTTKKIIRAFKKEISKRKSKTDLPKKTLN